MPITINYISDKLFVMEVNLGLFFIIFEIEKTNSLDCYNEFNLIFFFQNMFYNEFNLCQE